MIILAIETSCDDTCIAVVEAKKNKANASFKVLSSVVSSQTKLHSKYGGVYPFLAKREHQKNLPLVFRKSTKDLKKNIDLIAVTSGPGLEPCLWTGIVFARELAEKTSKDIIPINHVEAHILANFIDKKKASKIKFPAICLVASGGHTQLILMEGIGKYQILGETRDDAAGECFDKTARILGLGYPGGPIISKLAEKKKPSSNGLEINLPRPMISHKNYDFSFSGLKTAVLYDFRSRSKKTRESKQYIQAMAKEIEQSVIDVLVKKTVRAARDYRVKSVMLGGGVTSNKKLVSQMKQSLGKNIALIAPNQDLCTDNALMAAIAGFFNFSEKKKWKNISANANLKIDEKL